MIRDKYSDARRNAISIFPLMTWSSRNDAPRFKCIYLANNIIARIHTNRCSPSACLSLAGARKKWAENPVVAAYILVVVVSLDAHFELHDFNVCMSSIFN